MCMLIWGGAACCAGRPGAVWNKEGRMGVGKPLAGQGLGGCLRRLRRGIGWMRRPRLRRKIAWRRQAGGMRLTGRMGRFRGCTG